ncbi:MAG: acetyl-CoA acetyltransferase [Pseudomonadota bacterium]
MSTPAGIADDTPVLIGVGQLTVRDEPLDALSSPLDLIERAADLAADDAGLGRAALAGIDQIAVVKSFREPTRNSAESLANRLGVENAEHWLVPDGGQAPQALVNHYAEAIADGRARYVLLAGAEAMDNARRLIKSGGKPNWQEPAEHDAKYLFPDKPMGTRHESDHGIWRANHVYPLFENALRGHYGETIAEYQQRLGALFARFTDVAAESPTAWFPVRRSAGEIASVGPKNRYVAFPHTKFMNAMNQINQSAVLLITSVGQARKLGVPAARWVYLHGCADTSERGFMSGRVNYHSAPAVKVMAEQALGMAGKSIEDIDFIDIYSCFPCAVAIARDEFGIDRDDTRALTVTGGLPFHGGAGNSYSMNAIATMADRVRETPGSYGFVSANGGYLSKHAGGIYSTDAIHGRWSREDPASYQGAIDALPAPALNEQPSGPARLETYTVTFGRDGAPERGIVIGRLGHDDDTTAPRFLANLPEDRALLESVTEQDFLGMRGQVSHEGGLNRFEPAD